VSFLSFSVSVRCAAMSCFALKISLSHPLRGEFSNENLRFCLVSRVFYSIIGIDRKMPLPFIHPLFPVRRSFFADFFQHP
jgi:hypothetical protein